MHFPFLELPFELRLQIYEYYTVSQARTSTDVMRSFTLSGCTSLHRTHDSPHRIPASNGYTSLCSANRQIYEEMLPYRHSHPIRLTLIDDLFFNQSQDQLLQWPTQHPWLKAHVKEIRLHLTFSGERFTPYAQGQAYAISRDRVYDLPSLTQLYPSELQVRWKNLFRPVFKRDKIRFQQRNNLTKLANMLSRLPQLERIFVLWDHPDLFRTWTDIWGDLGALTGTGAVVKIGCYRGFGFHDFCSFAWSRGGRFIPMPIHGQENMRMIGNGENHYEPHYNGDALVSPDGNILVAVVSLAHIRVASAYESVPVLTW